MINKGTGESGAVHCMAAYSKGFVCGGDDGLLTLYDKSEDKDYFKKSRTFRIDNNNVLRIRQARETPQRVPRATHARGRRRSVCVGCRAAWHDIFGPSRRWMLQLAVSPTEEGLVCVVESGQMYLFALLNAEIIKPEDNSFEPVRGYSAACCRAEPSATTTRASRRCAALRSHSGGRRGLAA